MRIGRAEGENEAVFRALEAGGEVREGRGIGVESEIKPVLPGEAQGLFQRSRFVLMKVEDKDVVCTRSQSACLASPMETPRGPRRKSPRKGARLHGSPGCGRGRLVG